MKAKTRTGFAIVFIFVALACLAPILPIADPNMIDLPHHLLPPSHQNLLGTDQNGSSILAQIIWGSRVSLAVSIATVLISTSLGLLLGSLAGWFDRSFGPIVMRTVDLLHSFPGFLLSLAVASFVRPSVESVILILSISGWTGYARLIRAEVLQLRTQDFVVAAEALGASSVRMISRHIWPNLLGLLFVQMSLGLAGTVLAESALSFLGVGVPPTTPTWGAMLNSSRIYLFEAPYLCLMPGAALTLLVFGFYLIGDGLRDEFDPISGL